MCLFAALIAATAQSVPASASDRKPPPTARDESSPAVEDWIAEVGPDYIERQDALIKFVGWIHDNTAAEKSGYIAPVFHTEESRIVLLWKGANADLERQIVDEGKRRALNVEFERRQRSALDLQSMRNRAERSKSALSARGFTLQGIDGIRADPDIIVRGDFATGADARGGEVREHLESVLGTSKFRIEPADEGINLGTPDR